MSHGTKIDFRVSDQERQRILTKAKATNLTVSAFVRAAALNKPIQKIDGLRELIPELNRIGTI